MNRAAKDAENGATPKFYIPAAASLAEQPIRTLKQGDTFAIFDERGDIWSGHLAAQGLFHNDTRHLSHFALTVNGRQPLLLSSNVQDDNTILSIDLTNPDIYVHGHLLLQKDVIHLHRTKFIRDGVCHERIAVRNYGDRPHRIEIGLEFGADYMDLFEVRGHERARRGTFAIEERAADGLTLRYRGLDNVFRRTTLRFDPAPAELGEASARYVLDLQPGRTSVLFIAIACTEEPAKNVGQTFFAAFRTMRRSTRMAMAEVTSVETSNTIFNEMLCRSVADLYMLMSPTEHGWYPYAGIPWFSAPFGRDGIITAIETLWFDPRVAQGVLRYLAATQATTSDPAADAEPGKILHEARNGEMARLGEVPFLRYYGSVDATPLFVVLAALYLERTGDTATIEALWPNIQAALRWLAEMGDVDGDGFVEYARHNENGLVNQGWKDSQDAIFHADGQLAEGPIALCEVQGYVYLAKRGAAGMARRLGMSAVAATLEAEAAELRDRFEAAFWCEDIGTYALALDAKKRPCRVRTSNAGHALFAGIASPERAARIADGLMGPAGFSGWGIRTVARGEARYNPMSYHNGSVWPHDNALIGLGFARYGLKRPVLQIINGLFDAACHMDLRRLPELFCGFPRKHAEAPVAYPVACAPQAWASAAPLALIQACLGIGFDYRSGEIRFERPTLPPSLDEVTIRNLRIGDATATVLLRRHGEDVSVTVLDRKGSVRVVTVN